MPEPLLSHPDRVATTLANLAAAAAARAPAASVPPGAGAHDARIDLKLLQWRARRAATRSPLAAAHLATLAQERHPDVWAGTVQDGVARGFAVRLEEAIALGPEEPRERPLTAPRVTEGKQLRKRKDLLVKSGGARIRFSRKEGLLFVERDSERHVANCLRFEARADAGSLDGFVAVADERARLFSAQFLQPVRYVEGDDGQALCLRGRIGRGPIGWNCEAWFTGRADERSVRVQLQIEQRVVGWRLRTRWLGMSVGSVAHACTAVPEAVANDAGGFVAHTLVRACTTLRVDGGDVAVPGAACRGELVHTFRLGDAALDELERHG